jgi:phosphopantothenoylcysteine decarboxylase/phosphopantothenate--cysteine ligase
VESLFINSETLKGSTLLITAGPTREYIDPIRFVSNMSSGKTGFALARAAQQMGAQVILVSGPTHEDPPPGIDYMPVQTASEMLETVRKNITEATHVIMTAAVADYRPESRSDTKIKKGQTSITIQMERTEDILQTLVPEYPDKIWIGFAAETENLEEHARDKLNRKNLDMIVANEVSEEGYPFGADTNTVTILTKSGEKDVLKQMNKDRLAIEILNRIKTLKR